jgi:hypothetical protein
MIIDQCALSNTNCQFFLLLFYLELRDIGKMFSIWSHLIDIIERVYAYQNKIERTREREQALE